MPTGTKTPNKEAQVRDLFKLGAHFGYSRARRHPTTAPFIFGYKNRTAIIDLEKTVDQLEVAKAFAYDLGTKGKKLLFVGTKSEAVSAIKQAAESINAPYVVTRWLGGSITNADQMKKRVNRLADLKDQKVKGGLSVYTKKERSMIDKEIIDLEENFGNLGDPKEMPAAMFVVDPTHEHIAVKEAVMKKIPIIALANSDCDISSVAYPMVGNDAAKEAIAYFAKQIAEAYQAGKANPAKVEAPKTEVATESVVA